MSSTSRIGSKLKQFIKDDRPQRLKSFVGKHSVDLASVVLKRQRNLLHYCCKHGSATIMRYLLQVGVSARQVDDDRKCPLHIALERALKLEHGGRHDETTECYTGLVVPLLDRYPEFLGMSDSTGHTCRQLLHDLVQLRDATEDSRKQESEQASVDRAWRDKLADELQYEHHTTWGQYEPDESWSSREEETCSDWADRIREEYHARKRAEARSHYSSSAHSKTRHSKHKTSTSSGSEGATGQRSSKYDPETLQEARERMRQKYEEHRVKDITMATLKKRMKYEERYKNVMDRIGSDRKGNDGKDTLGSIKYDDIPWPSVKGEGHDLEVLFDKMDRSSTEYKRYLRDQQIRWHPDKFLQRFGTSLCEQDKERIVKRVTLLSQSLNKLKT